METRANYLLIGAFTVAGILGALLFFLWLAKVEVDRQYAYYETLFTDVTGLASAGDVRYNGLVVGRVVDLALDQDDPSKVRIRMELGADVPVKTDTIATLEYYGVTGVTFVALRGGSPDQPLLREASDAAVPVIESQRSAFQAFFQGGPELIEESLDLIREAQGFVSAENQAAVEQTLANIQTASGELESAISEVAGLTDDISGAAEDLKAFTGVLSEVAGTADQTLKTADETLRTATGAIQRAEGTIDAATGALTEAEKTFASVNTVVQEQVPNVVARIEGTATAAETAITDLSTRAGQTMDRVDQVADLVVARLTEAETTFAAVESSLTQANATMRSIEETSATVRTLVETDARQLVADARTTLAQASGAIATASQAIETDLPVITEDIKATTAQMNALISEISGDVQAFTGRLDALAVQGETTLATATNTMTNANVTLAAVTETMTSAEGALTAAEQTFTGVNRIIEEDVDGIIADVQALTRNLDAAIGPATRDIPQITRELKRTVAAATSFMGNLDQIVVDNSSNIEEFMSGGLPEFVRFVQEARKLISNLERLTSKIERDPARFLLGTQSSDFRR